MTVLLFVFIICAPTVLTQDSWSSAKHYCYVQSPFDASIFNLTTIQDDDSDSNIRINDISHLRVHFCRPLKEPCNGKEDYAVCLHFRNKEIGVGKEPPTVVFEFGKIMFKYTGDKCNETHDYTIDIEMKCNFAIEKLPVNLDVVYNRDQCSFQMAIETSAACAKRRQMTCDLKNDSGYFNLSPLIDLANNYMINLNNSLYVILNVCHSLIYGAHFKQCDHDSMVCLVDEINMENPSYTRLGNINNDLRISASNGSVYFDLTSDTPCAKDLNGGFKTIRTTIEFVCKEDATNKLPEYVSGLGTCHYKFRWLTIVACDESILIKHSEVNKEPCKITNPLYNELFDLSMLEGNVTFATSTDNTAQYQISVCSPLQKTNCTKEGTGVCKYFKDSKTAVSKGVANTNLMWRKNQIFLNYTDGIACGNNRRSYTTIIFRCYIHNTFEIEDRDPCATIIKWWSPMICNHRCTTPDNKINLQRLFWQSGNYHINGETNDIQYHMNVCEPLFDEGYTNCTFGTGICKVILSEKGEKISEINLGYPESGLHTSEDGAVYLRYVNGSVCEEDNSKRISSKITFTCDEGVDAAGYLFYTRANELMINMDFTRFLSIMHGVQKFESYSNCQYEFNWRTTHVCQTKHAAFVEQCVMKHKIGVFSLTNLIKNSSFTENRTESSGYLNATFCNNCNGKFVCDNSTYYTNGASSTLKRTNKLVVFALEDIPLCNDDTLYNSFINNWCRLWDKVGDPFLLIEEEPDKSPIEVSPLLVILIISAVVVAISLVFVTLYFYQNGQIRIMGIDCMANFMILFRRRWVQEEELAMAERL